MKLSVWTYEGPPHVGAIRVATGMEKYISFCMLRKVILTLIYYLQ